MSVLSAEQLQARAKRCGSQIQHTEYSINHFARICLSPKGRHLLVKCLCHNVSCFEGHPSLPSRFQRKRKPGPIRDLSPLRPKSGWFRFVSFYTSSRYPQSKRHPCEPHKSLVADTRCLLRQSEGSYLKWHPYSSSRAIMLLLGKGKRLYLAYVLGTVYVIICTYTCIRYVYLDIYTYTNIDKHAYIHKFIHAHAPLRNLDLGNRSAGF